MEKMFNEVNEFVGTKTYDLNNMTEESLFKVSVELRRDLGVCDLTLRGLIRQHVESNNGTLPEFHNYINRILNTSGVMSLSTFSILMDVLDVKVDSVKLTVSPSVSGDKVELPVLNNPNAISNAIIEGTLKEKL